MISLIRVPTVVPQFRLLMMTTAPTLHHVGGLGTSFGTAMTLSDVGYQCRAVLWIWAGAAS